MTHLSTEQQQEKTPEQKLADFQQEIRSNADLGNIDALELGREEMKMWEFFKTIVQKEEISDEDLEKIRDYRDLYFTDKNPSRVDFRAYIVDKVQGLSGQQDVAKLEKNKK